MEQSAVPGRLHALRRLPPALPEDDRNDPYLRPELRIWSCWRFPDALRLDQAEMINCISGPLLKNRGLMSRLNTPARWGGPGFAVRSACGRLMP